MAKRFSRREIPTFENRAHGCFGGTKRRARCTLSVGAGALVFACAMA